MKLLSLIAFACILFSCNKSPQKEEQIRFESTTDPNEPRDTINSVDGRTWVGTNGDISTTRHLEWNATTPSCDHLQVHPSEKRIARFIELFKLRPW